MSLRRLLAAPLLSATLVCTIAAAPASATDATPAPAPSASTAAAADTTQGQYSSLTGALMSMYAAQSGSTLDSYLKANQVKVNATQGTETAAPASAGATLSAGSMAVSDNAWDLTAATPTELDAQLSDAGYTLDLRNYSSMQDLATDVVAKSNTADASVTLAGAQWVSQLGTLRTPTLTSPTVGAATMPDVPQESLAFGLLMNQALANTVTQAPDLFSQAAASGVGSSELSSVFSNEMLNAWQSTSTSLNDLLPNKCTGAMLAVMASGDQNSANEYSGCNAACTTGGLYLHNQAGKVFGSSANQLSGNFNNELWSYGTVLSLQQWRTTDLLEQNPDVVQGLLTEDGTAGNSGMCSTASQSATTALKDTLPGIFANLQVAK